MANSEKGVQLPFDGIPCDFLGDILSRLDVKSLKRCECVSKWWLSLLRTPYDSEAQLESPLAIDIGVWKQSIKSAIENTAQEKGSNQPNLSTNEGAAVPEVVREGPERVSRVRMKPNMKKSFDAFSTANLGKYAEMLEQHKAETKETLSQLPIGSIPVPIPQSPLTGGNSGIAENPQLFEDRNDDILGRSKGDGIRSGWSSRSVTYSQSPISNSTNASIKSAIENTAQEKGSNQPNLSTNEGAAVPEVVREGPERVSRVRMKPIFLQKKVRRFDHHLSICNGETLVEISLHKFPFSEMDQPPLLFFMGSDYGVLCFYDLMDKVVYLWNPTINESRQLPQLGHNCSEFGLGYDPLTNDIKVVKFSSLDGSGVVSTCNKFKEGNQIGIYSLRSNSWKTMTMPNIFSKLESSSTSNIIVYPLMGCSIVVNECIHWMIGIGNKTDCDQSSSGIVAFDISREKFKLIKSPQIVKGSNVKKLANFSGWLSFFTLNEVHVVDIWVMKKYGDSDSWFKHLSVNLHSLLPNRFSSHSRCIPKDLLSNGNLLISCTGSDDWYSYDTRNKRLENMGERIGIRGLTTYVESTFKLNG
ncbi:hypothetical protein G4B88_031542 [Cannabis sativa]|uniref:F-box associated beta-propeller type 3 domain-containing protein n=1 Tax=Cannabis sativa TaxID=3483 RepID=A0A7J6G4J5_CANSA|nr:hypothetical protein G4B88_031542 [Cannabis sativa]